MRIPPAGTFISANGAWLLDGGGGGGANGQVLVASTTEASIYLTFGVAPAVGTFYNNQVLYVIMYDEF
jgi:hypothetical protein